MDPSEKEMVEKDIDGTPRGGGYNIGAIAGVTDNILSLQSL